jgi:hypothetical protein
MTYYSARSNEDSGEEIPSDLVLSSRDDICPSSPILTIQVPIFSYQTTQHDEIQSKNKDNENSRNTDDESQNSNNYDKLSINSIKSTLSE